MTTPTDIIDRFQRGNFSMRDQLAEFLLRSVEGGDSSLAIPFALVARHDDVEIFRQALEHAEDVDCLRNLIVASGLTSSPKAIPLVLSAVGDGDLPELTPYACLALDTICPIEGLSEDSITQDAVREAYADISCELMASGKYYYRGKPLFVGDLTKELVIASVASLEQKRPLTIIHQAELLSAESGVECPVRHGELVTQDSIRSVYAYVKELSAMPWERGAKLYWRHVLT